jgi:hypothetical protein
MAYTGNPNGAKQLWSKWTFTIHAAGGRASRQEVELNAARWLKKGFGSAGRARILPTRDGWKIECLIEGPPAHDPEYVASVRRQFQERFVAPKFGVLAWSSTTVRVMAGDAEDGKPRAQMVEMPHIVDEEFMKQLRLKRAN